MIVKCFVLFILSVSCSTAVWSLGFGSRTHNEIDDACKKRSTTACVLAHIWMLRDGKGNKCFLSGDLATESSVCTVVCKNITSEIRCNAEERQCDWDNGVCHSKVGRIVKAD